MPDYRPIPDPKYERDIEQLVKYYKQGFRDVARALTVITNPIEKQQAEALLAQITFMLKELDQQTQNWVQDVVAKEFKAGQSAALYGLGYAETLSEAAALASFSMLAKDTVEALINDTYSDLLLATQNTEKKVKQLVKQAVSDTIRQRAVEQLGRKSMRREITDRLAGRGLSRTLQEDSWVGIVDAAGRRWNLSTYAETVVRTKLQQAYIEGVRVETLERKVDLAVISSHGAKDGCGRFEGMVVSINGITTGYPTYSEIRATGLIFHPNCKHSINPIRDISLLPEALREKHQQGVKEAEKVLGKKFEPAKQQAPKPKPKPKAKPKPKKQPAPNVSKYEDQKTIKDAEAAMAKLYPHITFDFEGCDIRVINPTCRELDRLGKKYPEVMGRLNYIGSKGPNSPYPFKWGSNTWAHATRDGETIGINAAWYGDFQRLENSIEYCVKAKFHPKGSNNIESIICHEFGHQVHNWLLYDVRNQGKSILKNIKVSGFGLVDHLINSWQKCNFKATKSLSEYAVQKNKKDHTVPMRESFAESFTVNEWGLPAKSQKYVKHQRELLTYIMGNRDKWYNKGDWEYKQRLAMETDQQIKLENELADIYKKLGVDNF